MSYFSQPDKAAVLEMLKQLTEAVENDEAKPIDFQYSVALMGQHAIEIGLRFRIEDPR